MSLGAGIEGAHFQRIPLGVARLLAVDHRETHSLVAEWPHDGGARNSAVMLGLQAVVSMGGSILMNGPSMQMRRPSGEAQAPQMPTPHLVT